MKKLLAGLVVAFVSAAPVGAMTVVAPAGALAPASPAATAGRAHLGEEADPADSLWRAARAAISDERWDRAALLFERLRSKYPKSVYVADSYYWQAFALYQQGGSSELREAVDLLDRQQRLFASASTVKGGDSGSLRNRINGRLARGGDSRAAQDVARASESLGAAVGASVADAVRTGVAIAGEVAAAAASGAAAAASRAGSDAARAGGAAARASGRAARNGYQSGSRVPGCKDSEDDPRVEALNALLQMDGDRALPLLKSVLAKREPCTELLRRTAVFLVAQKRGDEAADILIAAAKNDPDQEVRENAVFWLGQTHSAKSVDFLEQILRTSKDEDLQDKALFALTQTRDRRGSAVLRDVAGRDDASEHMREQAVFWLGQNRDEDNATFLKQLFGKARGEELKNKILFSLSQQRSSSNADFLLDQAMNEKNSIEVRKQAIFWAGQSGAVDVARIGQIYDRTTDVEFKEQLIFVLQQRKEGAAITKLIDIAKTDRNRDLRSKAIFWLGQSRDPRALKAIQDIIEKPE